MTKPISFLREINLSISCIKATCLDIDIKFEPSDKSIMNKCLFLNKKKTRKEVYLPHVNDDQLSTYR